MPSPQPDDPANTGDNANMPPAEAATGHEKPVIELGKLNLSLALAIALHDELTAAIDSARSRGNSLLAEVEGAAGFEDSAATVSIEMSLGAAERLNAAFTSGPIQECCIRRRCPCT